MNVELDAVDVKSAEPAGNLLGHGPGNRSAGEPVPGQVSGAANDEDDFGVFRNRSWGRIYNTSFSSKLTNAPNKLECLSLVIFDSLVLSNTLAYWVQL